MSISENTPQDEITMAIARLRQTFDSKITLNIEWRLTQLKRLLFLIKDPALSIALYNDLHRSRFESSLLELNLIEDEINNAINNLKTWVKPIKHSTNLANLPGSSYTKYDPLGTVLVMSPWNYPLLLTFSPLVGAIAAGNTVLLRPANYCSNVSTVIYHLIDLYFNTPCDPFTVFQPKQGSESGPATIVSAQLNEYQLPPLVVPTSTNKSLSLPPTTSTTAPKLSHSTPTSLPHSNTATDKVYHEYLPIAVVLGDRKVTDYVLDFKFDYIFFTGGPQLGKIVLSKASHHLTPCTIELGGKSPAVIDEDVGDLDVIAKRLVWATFLNSGQTCVRPDYAFIHQKHYAKFLALCQHYILQFYADYEKSASLCSKMMGIADRSGEVPFEYHSQAQNANNTPNNNNNTQKQKPISSLIPIQPTTLFTNNATLPPIKASDQLAYRAICSINNATLNNNGNTLNNHPHSTIPDSPFFGRIINKAAFDRLVGILEKDKEFLHTGGLVEPTTRFISPTLISFPDITTFSQSGAMEDEIFGPILPCVQFTSLNDEVIPFIRKNNKPLALYFFSNNEKNKARISQQTSSGSLVYNDAIVQLSNHDLGFGGVGYSGYGRYHGVYTFQTFSHQKSILDKTTLCDVSARYPPYNSFKRGVFGVLNSVEGYKGVVSSMWNGGARL